MHSFFATRQPWLVNVLGQLQWCSAGVYCLSERVIAGLRHLARCLLYIRTADATNIPGEPTAKEEEMPHLYYNISTHDSAIAARVRRARF